MMMWHVLTWHVATLHLMICHLREVKIILRIIRNNFICKIAYMAKGDMARDDVACDDVA